MIRKFATAPRANIVPVLILVTILAGATTVHAQQDSAQQPPAQQPSSQQPSAQPQPENPQSSSSQETAAEEMPGRKLKVKDYKNWVFNVGGGANMTGGTTSKFVRSGGGVAAAGVARNYNRYFGLRFDFQWDNLPLRQTALALAQAPSATSHSYTFMFDPIVNIPVTRNWGGYVLGGFTYLYRSGKLQSSTAIPGSACTPFFQWWGTCFNASIPLSGNFLNAGENEFGENFGGGVTRVIRPNIQFYAEWRLLHAKRGLTTTDFRPITVGIRW